MPHEWENHTEHTLDATPEQVWEAIATGPGMDSWYMGRSEVEGRVGGTVRTDLGGYVQESTVTAYEPGRRFGYRGAPRGRLVPRTRVADRGPGEADQQAWQSWLTKLFT